MAEFRRAPEEQRPKQRLRIRKKTSATGELQAEITLTLSYDYLTALEKFMEEENFTARLAVLELIEDGLIRRNYLPSWWRERRF